MKLSQPSLLLHSELAQYSSRTSKVRLMFGIRMSLNMLPNKCLTRSRSVPNASQPAVKRGVVKTAKGDGGADVMLLMQSRILLTDLCTIGDEAGNFRTRLAKWISAVC